MLQCTNTWRPLVFSLCQRSLKFRSKSNERSISVSSDRNIWDFLRLDHRNLPFRFWQTGSLPCFSYVRSLEEELELWESDSLWLARFDRKFLGYPRYNKCHIRTLCLFLDFLVGIFWGSQNRGSRLGLLPGLTGSQNSLPPKYMHWLVKNLVSITWWRHRTSTRCWSNDGMSKENLHFDIQS